MSLRGIPPELAVPGGRVDRAPRVRGVLRARLVPDGPNRPLPGHDRVSNQRAVGHPLALPRPGSSSGSDLAEAFLVAIPGHRLDMFEADRLGPVDRLEKRNVLLACGTHVHSFAHQNRQPEGLRGLFIVKGAPLLGCAKPILVILATTVRAP